MIESSGATTLEGIRLFVALLAVAAVTAIVVRRLRVPYSVALVLITMSAILIYADIVKPVKLF